MGKLKGVPWIGIIALLSTIITGSWVADGLKGEALFSAWFPVLKDQRFLVTIGTAILFIISFVWLYNYRKVFLAVKALKQLQSCEPHECLILLLSTPNIVPENFSFPLTLKDSKGNSIILKGDSLKDDIESLNKTFWNWQQLLRGLEPHHEILKYVYIVGSAKSGQMAASFDFLDGAEHIIKRYCKQVEIIFKAEKPLYFENLKELTKIINKGIQQFKELEINEEDIIIDVTGGQKTTSIAGAVVALNSQVTFQYVQTNEPYNVMAYDVIIQSPVSI